MTTSHRVRQPSSSATGFTLIELMVTLAVIAILAAVALPAMQGMLVSNRLVSQTNEIVAAIQFARGEATRLNTPVVFCRATAVDDTVCSAAADAWPAWIVVAPALAQPVLRSGPVDPRLVLRTSGNVGTAITFRPDSLAWRNATTLLAGALRVCAPSDATNVNARRVLIANGSRVSTETLEQGAGGCNDVVAEP